MQVFMAQNTYKEDIAMKKAWKFYRESVQASRQVIRDNKAGFAYYCLFWIAVTAVLYAYNEREAGRL